MQMLATVKDDGSSAARVEALRNAWRRYMDAYSSPIKSADPESLATCNDSALWAAWRWFAQYNPKCIGSLEDIVNAPEEKVVEVITTAVDAIAPSASMKQVHADLVEYNADLRVPNCASEWPPVPAHESKVKNAFRLTT